MKKWTFIALLALIACACSQAVQQNDKKKTVSPAHSLSDTVYQSSDLIIRKLGSHSYLHISYLHTEDFGDVSCNGVVFLNDHKAVVFDTPTNDKASNELIHFVKKNLHAQLIGVIPTHYHTDCVGGLTAFAHESIPIFMRQQTRSFLLKKDTAFALPVTTFNDSLSIQLGSKEAKAYYFGEGHTADNIVGYFPEDHLLFGGCLIKELGASKGNLEDANTQAWPNTVKKVQAFFPTIKTIVPGHGKVGDMQLFTYTIQLFSEQ